MSEQGMKAGMRLSEGTRLKEGMKFIVERSRGEALLLAFVCRMEGNAISSG
jgi:hypothetical protein